MHIFYRWFCLMWFFTFLERNWLYESNFVHRSFLTSICIALCYICNGGKCHGSLVCTWSCHCLDRLLKKWLHITFLSFSLSLILYCAMPKTERNEKISYNFPNNLIKNLVPAAVLLKTILINTTSPSKSVSAKLFREWVPFWLFPSPSK